MKSITGRRSPSTSWIHLVLMSSLLPMIVGGTVAASITGTPKTLPHRRVATSAVPFPPYVLQAMRVIAKTTRVPVLGPLWLPDTKAAGSRLMPPGGTFAATVKATPTSYQMNFWVEAHAFPVNSPKVVQDSGDPSVTPIVTIIGRRYTTKTAAAHTVIHNAGIAWAPIPNTAKRVPITAKISGWIWKHKVTGNTNHSYQVMYVAWHERGWLIETVPIIPPKTNLSTVAVGTAQSLISKVMAPMPGQTGTIAIAMGDGMHTTTMWQRGRIVYSVFANYGLSSATTVVSSLYPMPR